MNVFNIVFVILTSYLIGTIPFSLIFSKLLGNKNPGEEGSKNYGAMNSYEITGKKTIGLLVFICDLLKGTTAVALAYFYIYPKNFYALLATIFVIIGHNFNVFLKFKGGRGLATALGAILVYNPFMAIIWGILWFVFYKIVKKDMMFANSWASLLTPALIIFTPDYSILAMNYTFYVWPVDYKILTIVVCMLIFAAHIRSYRYNNLK